MKKAQKKKEIYEKQDKVYHALMQIRSVAHSIKLANDKSKLDKKSITELMSVIENIIDPALKDADDVLDYL